MEKKILVKNGVRREFGERAAKIATEHLGWSEVTIFGRPAEVGTKTRPPVINKPIQLKEPSYPEPELKVDIIEPEYPASEKAAIREPVVIPKKVRKMPVRSKSVKK